MHLFTPHSTYGFVAYDISDITTWINDPTCPITLTTKIVAREIYLFNIANWVSLHKCDNLLIYSNECNFLIFFSIFH